MTELTTEQLASVLGVHRTTITRMVVQGKLIPVAGKGRGYRFNPETMRPQRESGAASSGGD